MMRKTTQEPRTETVVFKVSVSELKQLEARATPESSVHLIARDLVLDALEGTDPALLTILAEVIACRAETRNAFIGAGHLTADMAQAIKARADLDKRTRAQRAVA